MEGHDPMMAFGKNEDFSSHRTNEGYTALHEC